MLVRPTEEDYEALWEINPLALAQLKAIILLRVSKENHDKEQQPNGASAEPQISFGGGVSATTVTKGSVHHGAGHEVSRSSRPREPQA
jgi:hypothetical protein